ncbi:hypothetical protein QQ045_030025 [Rhodiola kirilowii]
MSTEHESQPSSQEASSNQKAYRSKIDSAWGHCKEIVEDGGKTALLCIYCNKIIRGGGINRFKYHLAGEKGQAERWTIFLKSVDASDVSKTAEMLYKLFKEGILYVGAENTVHIVTDNAANYVAAGRLLEARFPNLFWSPCAAHCINLMFQDIGKLAEVEEKYSVQPLPALPQILLHCKVYWVKGRIESNDKPAMSFLYRAIYKAREEMMWRFRRNKKKIEPYLEILDRHWDLQLRKNLHAAGYWLNLAIQFNNDEFD